MKRIIDKFVSDPSEVTMQTLIDQVRFSGVSDDDLAHLALALGNSGNLISFNGKGLTADLASTGGPTSLSTLLVPLYLRAMGCRVPKLGVPGRPAGGVDVLAQVPGYRVDLNSYELKKCMEQCGYAHFLASAEYAPLDAMLFKYRQKVGAQDVPELAIASLLSKKVAVGLERAALDVRVAPHGNFGKTWDQARQNAQRFIRVSSIVGIDAVAFLTDARFPYQPYVGRGEALVALGEVFSGSWNLRLRNHVNLCIAMACKTANGSSQGNAQGPLDIEDFFYENLRAQGSGRDAFKEYVQKIEAEHKFNFCAKKAGFVDVKLNRIRDLIVLFQKKSQEIASDFPDGMGIILRRTSGDFVLTGELIATVRVADAQWEFVERELEAAMPIMESLKTAPGFEEVING